MVLAFLGSKGAAGACIGARDHRGKVYSGVRVSIRGVNYR